jgi:hypothetical protein
MAFALEEKFASLIENSHKNVEKFLCALLILISKLPERPRDCNRAAKKLSPGPG